MTLTHSGKPKRWRTPKRKQGEMIRRDRHGNLVKKRKLDGSRIQLLKAQRYQWRGTNYPAGTKLRYLVRW
jgi:hypothetical protein